MLKNSTSILVIIYLGMILNSCQNGRGRINNDSLNKLIPQNIDNKENTSNFFDQDKSNDSLEVYQPDDREIQNILDGVFDIPELYVASSPENSSSITLDSSEKIIDYDVSPSGLLVASLTSDSVNNSNLKFWKIGQPDFFDEAKFNDTLKARYIAWHPNANAIFVIASKGDLDHILRLEKGESGWKSETIFSTTAQLKRIVICPRPFIIRYDIKLRKSIFSYRLFFGIQNEDGSFRIASVTEYGKRFYQVIGPVSTFTHSVEEDADPSNMAADWALPLSFHPSGEKLIWHDAQGDFFVARYLSKAWWQYEPLLKGTVKGGSITTTPN